MKSTIVLMELDLAALRWLDAGEIYHTVNDLTEASFGVPMERRRTMPSALLPSPMLFQELLMGDVPSNSMPDMCPSDLGNWMEVAFNPGSGDSARAIGFAGLMPVTFRIKPDGGGDTYERTYITADVWTGADSEVEFRQLVSHLLGPIASHMFPDETIVTFEPVPKHQNVRRAIELLGEYLPEEVATGKIRRIDTNGRRTPYLRGVLLGSSTGVEVL